MTTSEQIGELAAALAKAQAEMEGASKTALNPHFKNRYPDLASVRDACIPALTKHGIAVIQSPEVVNEIVSVETMLIHTSGQWIRGTVTCAAQNAGPQPIGSAITYLRRYSLMAFSGVAPDDDAEAASGRPAPQQAAKPGAPSGYDEWLKKLEGVADGGSDKLKAAWQSSAPDYRKHLTETDNGRWEALKAQSAMADVKLKLVLRMIAAHPFTVCEAEQRSPEWFAARLGRLTGSRAGDMLATIKTGEAAARRDLRVQLVCERLTQSVQEDGFVNAAMAWGIEQEPAAFAAYEALTGLMAQRTGFISHASLMVGCSLDGHVGDFEGITEFKAPKSATHLKYLRGAILPIDYLPQVRHNLWVTGAKWCDFMSYDPRFPAHLQTFLVRVEASTLDMAAYQRAVEAFLAEVDAEVEAVRGLR